MHAPLRVALLPLLLAAAVPSHAQESAATNAVTPAATALLDALAAKRAGVRTLTWRVASAGEFEATGYYRQGQGVRLSIEPVLDGNDMETCFVNGKVLSIDRLAGLVRTDLQAQEWRLLPFVVPLLDASQLVGLGSVDASAVSGSNRVLRIETAFPGGRGTAVRTLPLEFAFEPETLRLTSLQMGGPGATFRVSGYADAAGWAFPTSLVFGTEAPVRRLRFLMGGFRSEPQFRADAIVVNAAGTPPELAPDLRGLLDLDTQRTAEALRAALAEARAPRERASLAYSLAVRLEQDGREHSEVRAAAQQAAESDPAALAPALLLARLSLEEQPNMRTPLLEGLLTRFPQQKEAVYRNLLTLVRSAPMAYPLFPGGTSFDREMFEGMLPPPPAADERAWADRWLQDCPNSRAAQWHLFRVCQQQGDWNRAIEIAQQAAARATPAARSRWIASLAATFSVAGMNDKAIACFEQLQQEQPGDGAICEQLFQLYQRQRLTTKATEVADRLLSASNTSVQALDAVGRHFFACHDAARGIAAWRRTIALETSEAARLERQLALADLCLKGTSTNEAAEVLAGIQKGPPLEAGSARTEFERLQLELLRRTGRLDEHLATLEASLAKDPTNAALLERLASTYLGCNRPANAAAICQRLLAVRPDAASCAILLQCLNQTPRTRETLAIVARCFTNTPALRSMPEAVPQYVSACTSASEFESAIAMLRQYTNELGSAGQLWHGLGLALRDAGRLDEAAAALSNAAARASEPHLRDQARIDLAAVLGRQGKNAEAEAILRPLAAATNVENYVSQYAQRELLQVLRISGGLDAYLAQCRTNAASAAPKELESLAMALYQGNEYAAAADLYTRLWKQNPRNQSHWQMLVNCLQSARQPQALLEVYEAGLTNFPTGPGYYLQSYVYACQEAGKLERAAAFIKGLPAGDRTAMAAWSALGDALRNANRWADAADAYSNAVARAAAGTARDQYRLQLASALARCEQPAAAEAILVDLTRSNRTSSVAQQAQRELVQLLRQSGRAGTYLAELKARAGATPGRDDLSLLAQVATEAGDLAAAAAYCGELAKVDPSATTYQAWARALGGLRQWDAQIDALEQCITRFPAESRSCRYELQSACENARKPERLLAILRALAEKQRTDAETWQQLADASMEQSRWDDAAQAFAKAEEFAGSDYQRRELRFRRGQLLERREQWTEAEQWFDELARVATDDYQRSRARRELLTIRKKAGKLDAYVAELERAQQAKPDDRATLTLLIECCEAAGKRPEAARYAGALAAADPSENNFTRWISALRSAGKQAESVAAYEAFFQKFPGRRADQHLWGYAEALQAKGDTTNALAAAQQYAEKSREYYAYQQLAQFCQTLKRPDEAIAAWDKAIAIARPSEKRYLQTSRLRALADGGRTREALDAALRLRAERTAGDDSGSDLTWLLFDLLQKAGELDGFLAGLEKQTAEKPVAADLALLGDGYSRQSNYAGAAKTFGRLYELQPTENNGSRWLNALDNAQDPAGVIAASGEMIRRFPNRKVSCLETQLRALQRLNRVDEAIAAGEELVKLQPQSSYICQQLAQICRAARRYDQAIAWYQRQMESPEYRRSDDRRASVQLELATVLLEADKVEAAQAQVDAVIAAQPADYTLERALQLSTTILKKTGKWEARLQELEAQAQTTTNAALLLHYATACRERNDLPAAAGAYGRLARLAPSAENQRRWIQALGQAKDYAHQAEAIEAAIASRPNERQMWLDQLITAYENAGQMDKAIPLAKELLTQPNSDRNGYASQRLARVLQRAGRPAEAIPYQEEAVRKAQSYQRCTWAIELLGLCAEANDDARQEQTLAATLPWLADTSMGYFASNEKLKAALQAVNTRKPGFADAYLQAADARPDDLQTNAVAEVVCRLLGRTGEAARYRTRGIDILARAADAAPDNYEAQMKVARVCWQQNDQARAIPYLERAITLRPTEEPYNQLINAFENARKYDKQIATLQAVIAKFPANRSSRYASLARAYLAVEQPDQALATAAKAAETTVASDAAEGRLLVAEIHARLGHLTEAVAGYRALREEFSRSTETYRRNRADYLLNLIGNHCRKDAPALLAFLRKTREEVTDANTRQTLDWQIRQLTEPPVVPGTPRADDNQGEIRLLEASAAENPQNPVPLLNLASLYRRAGDRTKEIATLRRVLPIDGNPRNYLALVAALEASGDEKGALETYEMFFTARPASAPIQAAAYVSAAGRAGLLDAVAEKWTATLAKTPGDRTALAVQAFVRATRERLQAPGRRVPDPAAQTNRVWLVPTSGFPLLQDGARVDDFHAFASSMGLQNVRSTGFVTLGKQAWLATDRGVFQFDAEHRQWEEIGLNAAHMGKSIESMTTNTAGRIVFTATIDDKKQTFLLDPATERWSKPGGTP